jgi:hypothetical protein
MVVLLKFLSLAADKKSNGMDRKANTAPATVQVASGGWSFCGAGKKKSFSIYHLTFFNFHF